MFKLKKMGSFLIAVVMLVAMCAISPVMAAETDKVMFIDFTDTSADLLPMTDPDKNAGGRIDKKTDVCYGAAKQSGLWYVSGSKSSLSTYSVAESNMDLDKLAECDFFVIRFYSTFESDQFSFVIKSDAATKPYLTKVINITKSGWQEVAVPVSEIEASLPNKDITGISTFCMYKGAYSATSFVPKNHIYFDSMWFEKRKNNVVADADNDTLTLTKKDNSATVSINSDTVYGDSSSSFQWVNPEKAGSIQSVDLSTIGLSDPKAYTTLTFRMYSDAADIINLLVYYTNTSGTSKYVREPYTFSEEAGNIGKWVEVTLDLTCMDTKDVNLTTAASKLDNIRLNRGSWTTASTYNNNVYIDKIWFGEVEDINTIFNYKTSAYKDATDVGVYDTVTLEFEDYLSETIACDAVTVKRDGNVVTEFDAWADRNFLCVKTNSAMAFDSTYEITVTPALKDQRGYALSGNRTISFRTALPYLATEGVKLVDSNGKEIKALPASGTAVSASAEIVNGSEKDEKYVTVLVMYDSHGKMLGVSVSEPTDFVANMTVPHIIAAPGTVVEDTASIKGFLWNSLGTLVPYGAAAEIK